MLRKNDMYGQCIGYLYIIFLISDMPTIKKIQGPYRFFFYSFDCNEQMHVHVQKGKMTCKFLLEPAVLTRNQGFTSRELNAIREIIKNNGDKIKEAWDEHCGETTRSKN